MVNYFASILTGASAIAKGISTGFIFFLFASPIVVFFIIFMIRLKYKHTIVLRKKTKGNTDIVVTTKWKIVKKPGEPEYIQLLKPKISLPVPPDEALEMTEKGKYFVEGYLSEDNIISWINVESKNEMIEVEEGAPAPNKKLNAKIREEILKFLGEKPTKKEIEDLKFKVDKERVSDIKVTRLTTKDKAFYFSKMKEAEQKYKVRNIWDFLNQHAGGIIVLMIVFLLLIFWADVVEPSVEVSKTNKEIADTQLKITNQLSQIITRSQTIAEAPIYNITKSGETG